MIDRTSVLDVCILVRIPKITPRAIDVPVPIPIEHHYVIDDEPQEHRNRETEHNPERDATGFDERFHIGKGIGGVRVDGAGQVRRGSGEGGRRCPTGRRRAH